MESYISRNKRSKMLGKMQKDYKNMQFIFKEAEMGNWKNKH